MSARFRLRAAWRALRGEAPRVVVSPGLVKVEDISVSREMAQEIRKALARLDRERGTR